MWFHFLNKLYTKECQDIEMTEKWEGEKDSNKDVTENLCIKNTHSFKINFFGIYPTSLQKGKKRISSSLREK